MGQSLYSYIEWIELETFFSGFIGCYALVMLLSVSQPSSFRTSIRRRLGLAYPLVATLYILMLLKNLYPFDFGNIKASVQHTFLKCWAISAIGFWIPILRRRIIYPILHSSIFFFLLVFDIYAQLVSTRASASSFQNDLRIYVSSTLVYLGGYILLEMIFSLRKWIGSKTSSVATLKTSDNTHSNA